MYSITENPPYEAWRRVLDSFPQGNLWQTFEYGEVVKEAFPRTEVVRLLASNSSDEPVGLLQGAYSHYFGFGMSLGAHGGPLTRVADGEQSRLVESLLRALEDLSIKRRIIKAEVWWPESRGLIGLFDKLGYKPAGKFNEYTVILDKTVEDLWKSIHRNKRKNIQKALREGVEIIETHDNEDLLAFYRMLEAAAKRQGFVAPPLSWFGAFWGIFEPKQLLRIFFAEWSGKRVSGVFTVSDGKTIYALGAGSYEEGWKVRPNDLLHWKVMEWACEHNFSRYYMGLAEDPLPTQGSNSWGIWRWKREWNGELNAFKIFSKTYIPEYRYILSAKNLIEQSYLSLRTFFRRFP